MRTSYKTSMGMKCSCNGIFFLPKVIGSIRIGDITYLNTVVEITFWNRRYHLFVSNYHQFNSIFMFTLFIMWEQLSLQTLFEQVISPI